MFKRFKPKCCPLLGVDISPSSVKVVEISYHDGKPCIEGYGYRKLSASTGDSGRDNLVLTLKSLLAEINSSARFAAIAVPDAAVICKIVQLAENLNVMEMEELILLETKKYLPYPSEEINIDFVILGPAKNSLGMVDIYLAASRADNIRKRVDILRESGKDLKIVGIESQVIAAVARQIVAKKAYYPVKNDIFAIVQINSDSLHFHVFDYEKAVYSVEEVIGLKHSATLAIKNNLQLFLSTSPYHFIDSIYLTGDFKKMPGLEQEIQKETGIKTQAVHPGHDLSFSKAINSIRFKEEFPFYAVAYGLALRLMHEC